MQTFLRFSCLLYITLCVLFVNAQEKGIPTDDFVALSEYYVKTGWQTFKGEPSIEEQFGDFQMYKKKHFEEFVTVTTVSDVLPTLEEAEANAFKKGQFHLCNQIAEHETTSVSSKVIPNSSLTETIGPLIVTLASSDVISIDAYKKSETTCQAMFAGVPVYYMHNKEVTFSNNTPPEVVTEEKYNWEALEKFCLRHPLAKNAFKLYRIYRKVQGGYEVELGLASPVEKAGIKIGDLYYALDRETKTAEVVYRTSNKNLKNVCIPPYVTYMDTRYTVTSIMPTAFIECSQK